MAWLAECGTEVGPLFTNFDHAQKGDGRLSGTSIYRLVQRPGTLAGLGDKVRPHGLRHLAITTARRDESRRENSAPIGVRDRSEN